MNKTNKKVIVGMSGGVDSSVSAYLLKQKGYEVIGLFMQNWQSEPGEECTSEIDFKDASDVCDKLEIPLPNTNDVVLSAFVSRVNLLDVFIYDNEYGTAISDVSLLRALWYGLLLLESLV